MDQIDLKPLILVSAHTISPSQQIPTSTRTDNTLTLQFTGLSKLPLRL